MAFLYLLFFLTFNNYILSYLHYDGQTSVTNPEYQGDKSDTKEIHSLASAGDPKACYLLACYAQAHIGEMEYNKKDILMWYCKAAEGGIREAYYNLGRLCEQEGRLEEALNYYMQGAEKKDVCCLYRVALFYKIDRGLKDTLTPLQRLEYAASRYQAAANQEASRQPSFDQQYQKTEHYCQVNALYY